MAVAFHAVTDRPSFLRRALRAVALDAGLLRRRRDYRLLIGGQSVSLAGSELTFVAVPFQTFQITHSSLAVGLLGVAEFAPILVLALVGGAMADAFDRRRLVAVSELGSAVVALVLLGNALLADPHLSVLYVCAAFMAGFMALRRPPLDALVPQLVERDELKASAAIDFLSGNLAMIAARRSRARSSPSPASSSPTASTPRRSSSRSPRCARCAPLRPHPMRPRRRGARSSRASATRARARSCSAPISWT